jgi:hypothetical protein
LVQFDYLRILINEWTLQTLLTAADGPSREITVRSGTGVGM